MSFSESLSPSGSAAALDIDPMPGKFTGQARDLPAPFEFPSGTAVQFMARGSTLAGQPMQEKASGESGIDLTGVERAMVPAETAIRLQELANALARPPVAPAAVPAVPEAAQFSLTALASQLQTRFTQTIPTGGEGVDLLGDSLESRPSFAVVDPAPGSLPANPHHFIGQPPAPAATELDLFEKVTAPPVAKQATARQGDVFFMEPAPASKDTKELEATKVDLPRDVPDLIADEDSRDFMDLMAPPNGPEELPRVRLQPPAPFLPPPLPAAAAQEKLAFPADSGLGLILGGTLLILSGIFLACLLPSLWLTLAGAEAWTQQKTLAALVVHAAASLMALVLGAGSVLSRRWAPPLIHAAGWVAVLTVSGIIAATGFYLVNADADAPVPGAASLLQLLGALLGSLGCILYYQQESTAAACEAADPAPAWTDGLPVPALMVFLTGLAITVGAAAMLCHQPAFTIAVSLALTGPAATIAWVLLGILGLAIAVSVRLEKAAAVWLLLLTALILAATLSSAALPAGPVWEQFLTTLGRPTAAGPPAPLVALLAAFIPAPLLLIFAMARRAFSPPPLP